MLIRYTRRVPVRRTVVWPAVYATDRPDTSTAVGKSAASGAGMLANRESPPVRYAFVACAGTALPTRAQLNATATTARYSFSELPWRASLRFILPPARTVTWSETARGGHQAHVASLREAVWSGYHTMGAVGAAKVMSGGHRTPHSPSAAATTACRASADIPSAWNREGALEADPGPAE